MKYIQRTYCSTIASKHLINLLVIGLVYSSGIFAQNRTFYAAADREYSQFNFADAITLYEEGLQQGGDSDIKALQNLADAYYNVNAYKKAELTYKRLVGAIQNDTLTYKDILQYAEVLANNGNYNASKLWYGKYLERKASDSRGSAFSTAYTNVERIALNQSGWDLEFLSINTDRDEFSPTFYKDGLLFVSNRGHGTAFKRIFGWNNTPFTEIYYVEKQALKTIAEDSLDRYQIGNRSFEAMFNDDDTRRTSNDNRTVGYDFNYLNDPLGRSVASQTPVVKLKGKLNSKYHDGPVAVVNDSMLYFTRNNFSKGRYGKSADGTNKLKLYSSRLNRKQKWKSIEELPFNSDEYSVGHPGLSADGQTLFFASDRPGGYGGADLYKINRDADGSWGVPINLGPQINTEGDELFPFIDQNNWLIFSSTGLPGFGGLDLFRVPLSPNMTVAVVPENFGPPMNSPQDDFGLIMDKDALSGYFSSNRRGNDDIYSVYKDKIDLIATVLYKSDEAPVIEAEVVLVDGETKIDKRSNEAGQTHFLLEKNKDYTIAAIKKGFNKVNGTVSTKGHKPGETVEITMYLNACLKEFLVRAVYFDYDKHNIRPDGEEVLKEVLAMLKQNPDLNIEISAHTDQRASQQYNIRLSERRAKATRDYLSENGIDPNRMIVSYLGESALTNHCADGIKCTELEQQMNRRSEIQIVRDGVNLSNECAKSYDPELAKGNLYIIEGTVIDELSEYPIEGAKVTLNNGKSVDLLTGADGVFNFDLEHNTDYEFVFSRENYVTQRFYITTKGLVRDHTFTYVIKLAEIVLDKRFSKDQRP